MSYDNEKTILLLEDEELSQDGLKAQLEVGFYKISGPFCYVTEALEFINKKTECILAGLIDLKIPYEKSKFVREDDYKNGYKVACELKNKGIPTIIISQEIYTDILVDAVKKEISYLTKHDTTAQVVIHSIELSLEGCCTYSYRAISELSRYLKQDKLNPLNEEQWQIFVARVNGKTVKQIAKDMGFSSSTIGGRCTEIYNAIGVSNITEAVRWYHENAHRFPNTEEDPKTRLQAKVK